MQLDAHVSPDAERGAGLILQCGGRYLFVLAGNRYRNAESTFFVGIGGHLEAGETWLDCLRREAIEEIGAPVRVLDSETFYRITPDDRAIRATPLSPGADPRPMRSWRSTSPPTRPGTRADSPTPISSPSFEVDSKSSGARRRSMWTG